MIAESHELSIPLARRARSRLLPNLLGRDLGTNFTRIWAATAVSSLGNGVRFTALPLLTAAVTRNPAAVAGVTLAGRLPWLLFALVSGALADRLDRRLLMAAVDFVRCALVGSLAVAVALGETDLITLYVVSFALGCGETLFDNAAHAILPGVVERNRLEQANGRLEIATLAGSDLMGPMLGGLMFAALGAAPFFVDALTFGVGAILLTTMSGAFRAERATTAGVRADVREGLAWLWGHPLVRTISILGGVVNIVLFAGFFSIFVLYAQEILALDGVGFGALLSVFAFGGLLGSVLAARIAVRVGRASAVVFAILMAAVSYLVIGLTSGVAVVAFMLIGLAIAGSIWNVITTSMRQSLVPDRLLGRVNGAHRLIAWGAIPLGSLIGGLLSRSYGLRAPFLVGAAALFVTALCARRAFARLS